MFRRKLVSAAKSANFASQSKLNNFSKCKFNSKRVPAEPKSTNFALGTALGLVAGVAIGYYAFPQIIDSIKSFNQQQDKVKEIEDQVFSYKDHFDKYANVEKNGSKYMTQKAFIEALVLPRPRTPSWVAYRRTGGKLSVDYDLERDTQLKTLLSVADVDGDGLYSYSEFSLFLTLLTCDERQFDTTFKMFDLDGSGTVERNEFIQFIRANQLQSLNLKPDEVDYSQNGFVKYVEH